MKDVVDQHMWVEFKNHMIEEFENILKASGGTTMAQERYGTAFNATEADLEDT